ncbi:glucose-6-phosphatase 2-like isoform X3 [Ostrea edulis]|uniref:glucose-6-phosphatase 2-like isoform X3 n=1 Tax=Ostrea edulis TaxID=37623 RepID=UPI0024AEC806|nr:glucose-6-phosphatase 2-like isoform X3 [Ostrea edulis]XP_056015045.1 glucose-6-phosphatase 2-like isoform X3 [Ostrea edulis]
MGNQEPGIMDYVHLRGVEIIHQIQHTFRHHVDLMQILTRVGDPRYAFLIYFPLAYCLHQATGTRVLWIACLSEWLNGVLKWILHGQRPYWWVNEVKLHDNVLNIPSLEQYSLTCETGPGSPSGHAMVTSAVLYSIGTSFMQHGIQQAKAVERVLVWVSFTVVLVAVNVSRLFIATHFPHQVVAGSLTGILLAEVVKHEYTSGLTFKHYAIWCIVLVIGVCVTYFGISILSLDPLWSLTLAKKWCANPEWVHPDTTPFFTFTRDVSSLLGFGAGMSLLDKMKITVDIGMGQKVVYVTLSLTLTMVVENFKIPSTSPVFYVIGFVKFNIMMIGIVFVIPYLVFTNKKKKN